MTNLHLFLFNSLSIRFAYEFKLSSLGEHLTFSTNFFCATLPFSISARIFKKNQTEYLGVYLFSENELDTSDWWIRTMSELYLKSRTGGRDIIHNQNQTFAKDGLFRGIDTIIELDKLKRSSEFVHSGRIVVEAWLMVVEVSRRRKFPKLF